MAESKHPVTIGQKLALGALIGLVVGLLVHKETRPDHGRAIDGDTFVRDGVTYRLWGIDAPEVEQMCAEGVFDPYIGDDAGWMCGVEADRLLQRLVSAETVCDTVDTDRYGRAVAKCYSDGEDIADVMVRQGMALDWPRYSGGHYADAEAYARANSLGVWTGPFVAPWDLRRGYIEECVRNLPDGTATDIAADICE